MILDFETVQAITCGTETVEERDGVFHFERMTAQQHTAYPPESVMQQRMHASSGVYLAFYTDSKTLHFTYTVRAALRPFYHFDLWENDVLTYHSPDREGNDICDTLTIPLSAGEKKVELYLPFSKRTTLSDITLDDGASVRPAKRKRKIICYGDSITQGMDTGHPSLCYAMQLGRAFDAEVLNKGVAGGVFVPAIAQNETTLDADFVTVAYGTNDWSINDTEKDKKDIFDFFQAVTERYQKVFYIAPIWRKDLDRETQFPFDASHYCAFASEVLKDFPQVHIINPWNFVAHHESFFGDGKLHPNTLGHTLYASGLIEAIRREL